MKNDFDIELEEIQRMQNDFDIELEEIQRMQNDFDIELEKGNKIVEEMTPEQAMSWRPEDDYSDADFDFSNVQKLIKHPTLPTTLED